MITPRLEAAAREWAAGNEGSRIVAKRHGVASASICRAARELGLTHKRRVNAAGGFSKQTPAVEAAAREWILHGGTAKRLAKSLGIGVSSLRRAAIRMGLLPPKAVKKVNDNELHDIESWVETNKKAAAIRKRRILVLRSDPYAPQGVRP